MANFGIIRAKKVPGNGLGGMRSHVNREHESKTNPDIDWTKTKDNYTLECDAQHLGKRVNARIKSLNLKKAVRKDAVKLVDLVVTASPEAMEKLSKDERKKYFTAGLNFIKDFFGAENVMYSQVHVDEDTDHAHVGVVPITKDGRLCAKEVVGRLELCRLQDEFYEKVCKPFKLDRGEKGNNKRKHIETARFKADEAEKRAQEAEEREKDATENTEHIKNMVRKATLLQDSIDELKNVTGRATVKQGFLLDDKSKIEMRVEDFNRLKNITKRAIESGVAYVDVERKNEKNEIRANKAESALSEERAKSAKLQKELTDFKKANKDFLSIPERYRSLAKEGIEEKRAFVKSTLHDLNKVVGALYLKTKSTDKVRKTLNCKFSDAHIKSCAKNFLHQVTDRAKPAKDKKDWSAPAPNSTNYREPCSKNFNESIGSILDNAGSLPPNMASIPTELQMKFENWSLLSAEQKKKLLEEYELGRLI